MPGFFLRFCGSHIGVRTQLDLPTYGQQSLEDLSEKTQYNMEKWH